MTQGPSTQPRLTLFGPPQITSADGAAIAFRSRKHLALLAYLAVEQRHSASRDTLLALLWPEADEEAARNNLRVALADLRRGLGEAAVPFLQATRHTVQFDPASDHTLDVLAFRELLDASRAHSHEAQESCAACLARLEQAVALYRGEFLHGFSLPGCSAFEEWAIVEREQLHQAALEALATLAAAYERQGDHVAQCRHARRQIELEPWREQAHAQLMRGLWASGQRGAALEQYHTCQRILEAELGLSPSPELSALHQQIRTEANAELRVTHAELLPLELNRQPAALGALTLHNLPTPPTSFVGREAELAEVHEALASGRLVTLTGPGGSGKTRLALRAAAAALPTYADGVWLVELASLHDPALVPQAAAAALGLTLTATAGQSATAQLCAALGARQSLLLLDNCEHLAQACRELAGRLLHACPRVTILATSRELLHVAGEAVYPVPPLATPDTTLIDPEQLMAYESVRLFVERARAVRPGFALAARNGRAVAQICKRLDSIPLAIELAAARVRHLSVEAILAHLDDRFSLLTAGSHGSSRQQTLRSAIDWSYALLTEPEQLCFRRLGVFAGSFALPFAEAVVGPLAGAGQPRASVIELLAQLIDKSLLVAEQRDDGMRYRLLESTRAYAQEKLAAAGEAIATQDRHLACFVRLAEEAEPHLFSADQVAWLDTLAAEHNNLRAALDWAVERADAHAALRLVASLRSLWYTRGHYDEGRRRTLEVLAMPAAQERTIARASALNAAAALLWVGGEAGTALPLLDEALVIAREHGDPWNVGWALLHQGTIAYRQGDYPSARLLLEDGLASCRAAGPAGRRGVGWGLCFLGDLALDVGEPRQAGAYFAEGVDILRELSDYGLLAYPLRRLAHLALQQGDFAAARALCTESLRLNQAIDDRLAVVACLAAHASIAAAEGRATDGSRRAAHLRHAANLCGAVSAQLEAIGAPLWPADAAAVERLESALRDQLGEAAFAQERTAGRAMTIDQLLDAAAGPSAELPARHAPPPHNLPASLSACIGRDAELEELAALAESPDVRLITLVGVGGSGKTLLAIELGRSRLHHFADGVCFVALAPLSAASAIEPAILAALGGAVAGADSRQTLLQALRAKHILLILDNFEHVLEGASIVTELLQSAPQVEVVATSRERLNLRGEHPYFVHGLAYPRQATLSEAAGAAAVRVFVQYAQRVQRAFMLSARDLEAVLRICHLVEGMPLSLELAAALMESLSAAEIAAELEHSADVLAVEWGDLPERQRSLRAVFDWSWRSLSDAERQVFSQVALFRGGFTRQAAQTVVGASLHVLTRLVHKALLRVSGAQGGTGRYDQHELLRQFAVERLSEAPAEHAALARRHAAFYLALAENIGPGASGGQQEAWLTQIEREHDNIRAALAWAEAQDEPEVGLRLAAAAWPFWQRRCYLSEGRGWIERLLGSPRIMATPPAVRANALYGAGWLSHDQDDFASADAFFSECLQLDQALGQTGRVAAVLAHRAVMARGQGQYAEAMALVEESLALARKAHDQAGIAYALFRLGLVTREQGDFARAAAVYQECMAIYRALGDRGGVGFVLLGLADIARDQGDAALVQLRSAEALALGRALEQHWITGFALNNLALAASMQGDQARAAALADEALVLFNAHGVRGGVVELLITRGQVAAAAGSLEDAQASLLEGVRRGWPAGPCWLVATGLEELAPIVGGAADAVRLYAATASWRATMGAPLPPYRRPAWEAALTAARRTLGEEQFAAAWAEGAAWQPAQAVAAVSDHHERGEPHWP